MVGKREKWRLKSRLTSVAQLKGDHLVLKDVWLLNVVGLDATHKVGCGLGHLVHQHNERLLHAVHGKLMTSNTHDNVP